MRNIENLIDKKQIIRNSYIKNKNFKVTFILILIPSVVLAMAIAIAVGSADLTVFDVLQSFGRIITFQSSTSIDADMIIIKLRLPRILMAVIAGMVLGSTGAVMQGILKNPLADPYILGISSSAGFGASLAIISGIGVIGGEFMVVGNAFIFSMLAAMLILFLSSRKGSSPQSMVLIGLALLFFFQAMTTMLQYFGGSEAVKAALFWTVGDLKKSDWFNISILAPMSIVGIGFLIANAGKLNILNAGDDSAKALGLDVKKTRRWAMVVSAILVAGIVSFTGTIGFIGLVAPHLVRMVIGNDNRFLILGSGFVGAWLLLISDTIARTVLSPVMLPVGAVTAFLGVPLFLYLILHRKRSLF